PCGNCDIPGAGWPSRRRSSNTDRSAPAFQPPAVSYFWAMSELSRVTGVGPKREKILAEAGIRQLRDLVYHLPRRYIDRTRFTPIAELEAGKDAIFCATVVSLSVIQTRMVVEVEDSSGTVDLVFFNGVQFLRGRFHEGQRLAVSGVPGLFRDQVHFVHPEFETIQDGREPKS